MESLDDWTRRLRFRHLKLLLALHETRNLSRAAARMAMTQPALSKWLRELESDLGTVLFERHSRGIVPTPACEVLAERSRLVLNELARTSDLLHLLARGHDGSLTLGTTPLAIAETLPAAIARFQQEFPDAVLGVTDGYLDQLLPQLLEGRLDLVLSVLEDRQYGGELAQERLHEERFVVVTGPTHALARRRRLGWQELVQYPWIGPPANSPVRRELEHECALANVPLPRFAVEATTTVLLVSLLGRTEMLSLMSSESARYYKGLGRMAILPVPVRRSNHLGMLWRKDKVLGPLERGMMAALRVAARRKA